MFLDFSGIFVLPTFVGAVLVGATYFLAKGKKITLEQEAQDLLADAEKDGSKFVPFTRDEIAKFNTKLDTIAGIIRADAPKVVAKIQADSVAVATGIKADVAKFDASAKADATKIETEVKKVVTEFKNDL